MKMYNLVSGSGGNCTLVCSEHAKVLIDVGMSRTALKKSLEQIGYGIEEIDGIILTHEHHDHVKGIGVVARKDALPIYATRGTIHKLQAKSGIGDILSSLFHDIRADEEFEIKDIRIQPMAISHDAAEPIAVKLSADCKNLAVVTDLGCFDHSLQNKLQGLDGLLLESNHDVNMLQVGSYPFQLKRRILGDYGHLSNASAAKLLKSIWHKGLTQVILGHLSEENNMPELALQNMKNEMFAYGNATEDLLKIRVAAASQMLKTEI